MILNQDIFYYHGIMHLVTYEITCLVRLCLKNMHQAQGYFLSMFLAGTLLYIRFPMQSHKEDLLCKETWWRFVKQALCTVGKLVSRRAEPPNESLMQQIAQIGRRVSSESCEDEAYGCENAWLQFRSGQKRPDPILQNGYKRIELKSS